MESRINVITLGVSNLERSKKFYTELGFIPAAVSYDNLAVFQLNGLVFCLFPRDLLAEDVTVDPKGEGFRGITLAYNVRQKEDVEITLKHAEKCGAKIIKEAQDVFWGGHSGYFADPDGHLFEVAWNPFWTLNPSGLIEKL